MDLARLLSAAGHSPSSEPLDNPIFVGEFTCLAMGKVLVLTRLDSILTGELSAPAAKRKGVEAKPP